MNGIVIIDKPAGWTSQDVTARLRRVFGTRRIGHGGTLDPMATGVLPVFVGRGTRGVEFFEHAEKTYETELLLGVATDPEDTTGTELLRREVSGQMLCDLARKGRQVERQPRPVTVHELTLLSREGDTLRLRVRCSKGTYIRTLCADIGEALGCGGCMQALRRTQAGEYTIAEAVPLQQLLEAAEPETYLRDVDTMFRGYPGVKLTGNQEKRCRNGNAFSGTLPAGTSRAYSLP